MSSACHRILPSFFFSIWELSYSSLKKGRAKLRLLEKQESFSPSPLILQMWKCNRSYCSYLKHLLEDTNISTVLMASIRSFQRCFISLFRWKKQSTGPSNFRFLYCIYHCRLAWRLSKQCSVMMKQISEMLYLKHRRLL